VRECNLTCDFVCSIVIIYRKYRKGKKEAIFVVVIQWNLFLPLLSLFYCFRVFFGQSGPLQGKTWLGLMLESCLWWCVGFFVIKSSFILVVTCWKISLHCDLSSFIMVVTRQNIMREI
jgi:hypothetical protein